MKAQGSPRRRFLKALIVDDEPLAREGIRRLLKAETDIVIAGECRDGVEAIGMIRAKRPDLLFLDIQMPEIDGFEVLRAIGTDAVPAVIFVTAHDVHAVHAFDVHAVDYLLKPVDPARFTRSLDRARSVLRRGSTAAAGRRLSSVLREMNGQTRHLERLVVRAGRRVVIVRTDAIDWIEAKGDYVVLHTGGRKYLVREKISSLENRVDPGRFVRIHRSSIVNVDRVREMVPRAHGEHHVILEDGSRLVLSRGYRDAAFRRITGAG